jgi:23S rRNA (uracil1939-C5)-methyltransferase
MARRGPREIQLVVTGLSEDGLGEGSYEARTVRTRNALPGEAVDVIIRKRRGGIWYGEAASPSVPAPQRQRPPCSAFPRCAGCVLQHLDYPRQLEHKSGVLQRELVRHGVAPVKLRAPVGVAQLHYRYKARLGVRVVDGEVLIGFREGFGNRVARTGDCKTLALPFVRMLPSLRETLQGLRRPDRIPQIELAGGEREAAIVVRHLTELDEHELDGFIRFARRTGIRVYLQPGGYDTIRRLDPGAEEYLSYTLPDFGLCLRFLPTDFIQVNPLVNRALVRAALLGLDPRPGATALDLFCGIGNFSLALTRRGVRVRGYESSATAVARARFNAYGNGLDQWAEFEPADLYDARCSNLPDAEYLLLDPPRSGAGPNLERWAAGPKLERVAYVSCNPASFAADAAVLQSRGFVLEEVGIFDMFPHTAHVETLGIFARNAAAQARG